MCEVGPFLNTIRDYAYLIEVPFAQSDIQMSVSTLLVLGDKASGLIDDQITEQWFSSYVGELSN